jgi:hypothetical protein
MNRTTRWLNAGGPSTRLWAAFLVIRQFTLNISS